MANFSHFRWQHFFPISKQHFLSHQFLPDQKNWLSLFGIQGQAAMKISLFMTELSCGAKPRGELRTTKRRFYCNQPEHRLYWEPRRTSIQPLPSHARQLSPSYCEGIYNFSVGSIFKCLYQVWQLVRMENKPCWNSKSMGMHLAHNIRILKIKSKKIFFAS